MDHGKEPLRATGAEHAGKHMNSDEDGWMKEPVLTMVDHLHEYLA
jgi:hypothetical protein